jgi:hypothetical protein
VVTYRAAWENWYVLSGRVRDKLFYGRHVQAGEHFASFEFSYPAHASALWNPIAEKMSRCFRP